MHAESCRERSGGKPLLSSAHAIVKPATTALADERSNFAMSMSSRPEGQKHIYNKHSQHRRVFKIPLKPRQPRRQSPNSACAIFGLRPRLSAPTILQTHLNLQTTNGACVSAPVTGDPHSLFAKQTTVVTTERLWEKCTQQSAPKPLQASPVQTMRS